MYTCIWLKRRGVNVLEFQLGRFVCLVNAVVLANTLAPTQGQ